MALEQMRTCQRGLFVGAVLGLACASLSCTSFDQPSIRTAQVPLNEGIQRWRARASPEDQAVIDELLERKDLLVHVIFGKLPEAYSRGAASATTSAPLSKANCLMHPKIVGGQPEWDWDLIYDSKLAEKWEKKHKIPNPLETNLHHEIFGHILPTLRNPEVAVALRKDPNLADTLERQALAEENRYRRYLGLLEVPPELPETPDE